MYAKIIPKYSYIEYLIITVSCVKWLKHRNYFMIISRQIVSGFLEYGKKEKVLNASYGVSGEVKMSPICKINPWF